MAKVSAKNEEHANHKSEQSSMENVITKHINSEGTVTTENSTKSSYDVEELKKVLDSDSIDNSEIKDGGKIMPKEPSERKEATGLELQKPKIESFRDENKARTIKHEQVRENTNEASTREHQRSKYRRTPTSSTINEMKQQQR
ncbi:hypothetical protein CR513_09066 [Mucuna pruriens]|uniref:Uncharacterized protein n=1 Tax=Mucuna pruriens TaxID=157652 RepID=A0A371HVS2_MUCPR|nr:hypothetical protein CR513_09066 [Mucuna pruriens]